MFGAKELNELTERKRLLLLEAEVHRRVIALECESLKARLVVFQEARERVAGGGPWLMAGSAVAGLLAVRHWRTLLRWAPAGLSAIRWFKKLRPRK